MDLLYRNKDGKDQHEEVEMPSKGGWNNVNCGWSNVDDLV
jgi:hypothetical protein